MSSARSQNLRLMLFLLPALTLFTTFVILPFLMGVGYSFLDWNGVSPDWVFVGLKNYGKMFRNKHFMQSLWFTLRFTVVTVITQNLGALVIANLLDSVKRGKNFFKGVFFVPNVLSGVIVAFIWGFIFTKVLPGIAQITGLEFLGISWFSNPTYAFWSTVIVAFWLGTGYLTIVYLAGLNSIDPAIIEAARIDGASAFQQLFRIKLPLIMPSVIIGLFLVTMNGLKQFEIVFLMTGGGPYRSTETLALLSYNTAYVSRSFGDATAQAIILFVIVAIVTTTQLLLLKKREVES